MVESAAAADRSIKVERREYDVTRLEDCLHFLHFKLKGGGQSEGSRWVDIELLPSLFYVKLLGSKPEASPVRM